MAQPTQFGVFTGTETTASGDPTNLNDSAAPMEWSTSQFDSSYFSHSTSSFSHEITIQTFGDYHLSLNAPLDLISTDGIRRQVVVDVYVNGSPVPQGRAASSYIRQSSSHSESSLSLSVLLESLNANDKITVYFASGASTGTVTTPGTQMVLKYVAPSESIFSGYATQSTSGTNLNQGAASLEWAESIKDSDYTHNDGASPENITLAAGDYLVHVSLPLDSSAACNGRNSVKMEIRLDGATVTGGTASQGYIRCIDNHDTSSVHWVGLLEGVTGGQVLSVQTSNETTRTDNTTVPAGREASLFIEKVNASSEFISLTGTSVLSGANHNPTVESEVQWGTQLAYDASTFTHSTSSNNHLITIAIDGDYYLTYNDHMTSTTARANNATRIKVNGSVLNTGVCKTHYIRTSEGHAESSCSMTQYLQGLTSGDQVSIEHYYEAATGTVNDASPARLTLQRVGDSTDPGTCSTIIDCTPDLVLHYDGQQLQSMLDDANRTANDSSFDGTVATLLDVSGSDSDHDGTQGGGANEPTFNTVTSGMTFDGTDYFDIANHPDLNTGTLKEKSIVAVFQTGSDVTSPQVIYEEGGTIRGMNVYIRAGNLYIAFWNLANDGDGSQAFTSASTPVSANSFYYASLVIDYSNYTGPTGPDGELRGHINGVAFGSLGTTTSLLYPHGGAIALGGMRNGTYFDTGAQGGNGNYFDGEIYEFLIYNHAISNADALDFYDYLSNKWPDPQPPTSFALSSSYTTDNTQSPLLTWVDSVSPDVNDFQIAVGTTAGAVDVLGFTSQGNVTSTNVIGLSLSECVDYYATIKAIDSGLDESTEVTSDFFRYDGTNPSDPSGIVVSGTASTTTSKDFSWTSSSDTCSFAGYDVSIGSAAGLDDVVAWTDIGNTLGHTFTGITPNLVTATDYYFNIRGRDEAGNFSSVVSSSSWQLDTCVASDVTDPTDPSSFTLSGDGGPTSSPNHSWTASTDACGLSHYEIALGTSAGATDVVTWTNIGNVTSHKFFNISPSLSATTDYYSSIRAVDLAGNTSNQINGGPWQLPTPGNVSSGLVLWLDADDSGTLYSDNTCLTPATTDGSSIGCWQDKSTSTNNATATGTARPTLQTNEFNSQSIVRFDGTNDALDFTNIADIRTVFVVNKSSGNTYQQILGHSTSQNFYTNNSTLLDGTLSSTNLRSGSWRADQASVSSPQTYTQSGSYSLISVVSTGDVEADHLASDRKVGGRFFNGDIVEVIVYDRALNSTEVTDVETYLYNKWFTAIPATVTSLAFDSSYSTSATQSPGFSWTHSVAPDIDYYEVALGTSQGSNDISGWTNIGVVNSYQFLGQNLTECQDLYASVRVVDTDSFTSSFTSTSIGRFDGTSPNDPTSLILSGTSSPTDSQTLTWSPSADSCSTVSYEVALGTTSGGNDVVDWTATSSTTYEFTSIFPNLSYATDYYLSVRSVDEAGNTSNTVSSSSWQLDTCISTDVTSPTDPSSLNLTGGSSVTRSPTLSWTSSSDSCSMDHYEVAIGSAAGLSDVVGFSDVGNVTSYQFTQLGSNLSFSTNYYVTLKAVDSAGNESSVVSSSAWQLTSPGNVSPLGMEIWFDASDNYTLYQDSGCSSTQVTTDSQDVLCIRDKSGNDNHGTSASSGTAPIYRTTQFNGNPSLYFNGGVDEYLTFASRLTNIRTVFWVIKEDSSNPGNTAFLLGDSSGSTSDFHRDSTSGPIFSAGSASANVTGGSLQQNTVGITGTSTNMPTSESVLSLVTTGNVTADSFSRDRTSCCGNRTWGGFASEVIIFNRALSGSEITDVENYLMVKWGVTSPDTQWLGGTSTDWFTPGNWSNGLPDATRNCVIPDQANDPVINGTAICRDVQITTGTVTLQAATGSTLVAQGDFSNNGSLVFNDGQLEFRDDGLTPSNQTLTSVSTLANLSFNKTAGGSVSLGSTNLTVSSMDIPLGSNFSFEVPNNTTLNLTTGLTMAAGTFDIQGGGTLNVTNGQSISVTGGTFQVSGSNDVYPQDTSTKGTITSSGRWGFHATAGSVSLTGFVLDNLDVNGLRITGTANLTAFDGGQFTNLLNDFSTPVRALVLDTTTSLTETLASNIGFSWSSANATYSAIATPSDNYYLVHANNCNNSVLVFDQWFGDFWGASPQPTVEDKIQDTDDGASCQVSMDVAASPVHLTLFEGTPYDEQVLLTWETGSELNHLGFNIYRSDSMYGNYDQINQEIIQNFVNTANFKGRYAYVDAGLTNDQTYYYMIEDIALNGSSELHGPVAAMPQALLGSAPVDSSLPGDTNVISDGNDTPGSNTDVTGDDSDVLTETQSGLRLRIRPTALSLSAASWDSNYRDVSAPGYGQVLDPGAPAVLYRRFLVEVEKSYTSVSASLVAVAYDDYTSSLAGQPLSPAAEWTLNVSSGQLEDSYTPDSSLYSLNQWYPSQNYEVMTSTTSLNGKNFLQVDVWPVRYNPVTDQLEQINELVLDIDLDGTSWDSPTLPSDFVPEPESLENNLAIRFKETGLYELTYDSLIAASLEGPFANENVDDLRLYHHGQEIPLEIESGDGVLNSGDRIRFFARFENHRDDDEDQVILSLSDLRKEADMDPDYDAPYRFHSVSNGYSQQPESPEAYYRKEIEREDNLYAVFDVPLGAHQDHIFWKRIFTEGGAGFTANSHHDFSIDLDDLHTSNDQSIEIQVDLRGRGVFELNPQHELGLYLNGSGTAQTKVTFSGSKAQTVSLSFPSYALTAGTNNFRLSAEASYVNSGDYDLIDINRVRILYPAYFEAVDDVIHLSDGQPDQSFEVTGFTSSNVKIYDISEAKDGMLYQDFSITSHAGNYLLQFDSFQGTSGRAGREFYILENAQYKTPTSMDLTFGNDLHLKDPSFSAEYLLVAPHHLLDVSQSLVDHRSSQGLNVKMVSIEQVYDEFSGGRVSSQALKDFISLLIQNTGDQLKYLLIVGDATYDPKGDLNSYGLSQMPVALESGDQMDYASDNFFVELDSQIPQISVGRIPTSNEVEIRNYINKLIAYENGVGVPENPKNNFFISGVDKLNEDFDSQTDRLAQTLTGQNTAMSSNKVNLSDYASDSEKKSAIENVFSSGGLVATYYGHGAENMWDDINTFDEEDAKALSNQSLPIVMTLNCLNSYYYDIDETQKSIGENFILSENGGAIAFWGSTSQTSPVAQMNLAQSFLGQLADATNKTYHSVRLGDLILQAKQLQGTNAYASDTVRSWTLFGDPALQIPEKAFAVQEQSNPGIDTTPTDPTPAPVAPASGGGGGGGCSAFAGNTHSPSQDSIPWRELIFFFIPIALIRLLRSTTPFLASKNRPK